jgi:transcriptional regulator with XRE-family HTH domain
VDMTPLRVKMTIKAAMKAKGLKYQQLAEALQVSVSTVKRILSDDDLSLERLSKIATWLEIPFYDLIEASKKEQINLSRMNEEQERFIADHPDIAQLYWLMLLGRSFNRACQEIGIDDAAGQPLLDLLKCMDLIRVGVSGTVRPTIRWPVDWIFKGPLHRKYMSAVIENFLKHLNRRVEALEQPVEAADSFHYRMEQLTLSKNSYAQLLHELRSIFAKYLDIANVECAIQGSDDLEIVTLLSGADLHDPITSTFKSESLAKQF